MTTTLAPSLLTSLADSYHRRGATITVNHLDDVTICSWRGLDPPPQPELVRMADAMLGMHQLGISEGDTRFSLAVGGTAGDYTREELHQLRQLLDPDIVAGDTPAPDTYVNIGAFSLLPNFVKLVSPHQRKDDPGWWLIMQRTIFAFTSAQLNELHRLLHPDILDAIIRMRDAV